MARIRTIKPEFWRHEALSESPEAVHMLAAALLNYADDEGYFNANPKLVKAECFPLREPSVSVHDGLTHLSNMGYIRLGTGEDGRRYGLIVTFSEHQRINRPTLSKIKALQIEWDAAVSTHTQLSEPSLPERNREQGKEQGKEVVAEAPKYAFEGVVVRLTPKDLSSWEATFRHIPNLRAELTSRDAWLSEQDDATRKKWFQSTSTWLRNRDAEFAAKPKPAEPAKRPTASSISDAKDFDPMKPFRPCAKNSPAEAEQLAWMNREGKWADWDQRREAR